MDKSEVDAYVRAGEIAKRVHQKTYNVKGHDSIISFTDFMSPGDRNGLPDVLFFGGIF